MKESRRGSNAIIALAIALATVTVPLYAVKVSRKHDYTDFEVYYRAAERVQKGQWSEVYNLKDGASPFRYAPPLLPFFRPFAELPLPQARMSWYFLQCIWFALGFLFLERALRLTRAGRGDARRLAPQQSSLLTALSFLFVLRFCLDCFTIGQVSSLLFMGYSAALWAWMARKPGATGAFMLVPSVFKIGPGFLFSLFATAPKRSEQVRAVGVPLLLILLATAFLRFWCGSMEAFRALWSGWTEIVLNDSVYYDASHYGSQSIKSAILRAGQAGWLTAEQAQLLYLSSAIAGCVAILGFWLTRRARSPLGRGAFFALGVFPYLWFMPETFKYSLTTLAIPVGILLADISKNGRRDRLAVFALVFGALVLSVAGLDIVGARLFFGLQRASIPLVATLFLGAAVWRTAYRHSRPSWSRTDHAPAPWPTSPRSEPECTVSVLLPLPMQSTAVLNASWLQSLVMRHHARLLECKQAGAPSGSFEILMIPYGNRASRFHPAWQEAERLANTLEQVRLLPCSSTAERGSALRDGFLASSGRYLLGLNAENPAEPEFYQQATEKLARGQGDLIRGNRRHPDSRFRIPVRTLPLVYGRHRMALLFNRLVRLILPVQTTDTHSGSWAMTRRAAIAIFALQKSLGFLFDLEACLTAQAHGFKQLDLPVSLYLPQEKSARRVSGEAWAILRGIPALWLRYRAGCYSPTATGPSGITADDWGLTPGVNQGILELARLGIVRRVSLMADGGHLGAGLRELTAIPGLSLGLHFDLTLGKAAPASLLRQWLRPGRDRARMAVHVRAELVRPLVILRQAGVKVTHLDGHHHIHLIPGMLDVLAPVIVDAGIRAVRLPEDPALLWRKPMLWLLTRFARGAYRRHGFESLPCFYPQAGHFTDQGRFRAALRRKPRAEVHTHPAALDDLMAHQGPDPYTSGRVTEYRALRMLAFDRETLPL
jgi:predicted glycoside hydrolase/deacetylase ChbG (UPF0249 family)